MSAELYYSPFIPTFNSNGLPVAGASLTFYYTGTTTLAPVYAGSGLTTPLANPVVANAAAKYPNIYLDSAITYRVRTKNAAGVQIGDDADPYIPGTAINGGVGPPGGNVLSVGAFSIFGTLTIAAGTDLIQTTGYDTVGTAAGIYVDDALSDAALAAAHPRFCKASANGRYFRLLPKNGWITLKQAGGVCDNVANDHLAWQACLDYVYAVADATKVFVEDSFANWCPIRTSNAGQDTTDAWAADGQFSWIKADVHIEGANQYVTMYCKGYLGGSLETEFQNVGGNVWRGSGINLIGGTQADPDLYGLTHFSMRNFRISGGQNYTGDRTTVTVASPDGPDLTSKGFRLQDTACPRITMENIEIFSWKGEIFYSASSLEYVQTSLINCRFHTSNQSALNPSSGGGLVVIGGEFGNTFAAAEILGRAGGRIVGARFYDSEQFTLTGGPGDGLLYNYAYPTRDAAGNPPWFDLFDVQMDYCGEAIMANFIRGNIRATDTIFTMNANPNGSLQSMHLNIESTIDRLAMTAAVTLTGPPTLTTLIPGAGGSNYILPPADIQIDLRVRRTVQGRANAKTATSAFRFEGGYFDMDSCSLRLHEADGVAYTLINGTDPEGMPLLVQHVPINSHIIGGGNPLGGFEVAVAASPFSLKMRSTIHSLIGAAAVTYEITMVTGFAGGYKYAFGQTVRIYYNATSTAGAVMLFRKAGTGLQGTADRRLRQSGDWIDLEFRQDTVKWHEVGFHSKSPDYCTVAQLPAASATYQGDRMTVTDANATLTAGIGAVVAAGGANIVPVHCDATNWRIG